MSCHEHHRLPHWDSQNAALFITWRLHGSLPAPLPEWESLPAGRRFAAEDRVLSNHVHIKNYSAREANSILNRTGRPFWQMESYDHWVHDPKEFDNIVRYIEDNPVKAGLVSNPEDWAWSSARAGQEAYRT